MLDTLWIDLNVAFSRFWMELQFWFDNQNGKIGVLLPTLFILMFFLQNIKKGMHKETKLFWAALLMSLFIGCLTSYRHDYSQGGELYTSVRIFCFFPPIFLILAALSKSPAICEHTECLPFYFFAGTFLSQFLSDIYSAYSFYEYGFLAGIGGAGIYDGLVITPFAMSLMGILYSRSKKSELAQNARKLRKEQESKEVES